MRGELLAIVPPGLEASMGRRLSVLCGNGRYQVERLRTTFFDDEPFDGLAGVEECFLRVEAILGKYPPHQLRILTVFIAIEVTLPSFKYGSDGSIKNATSPQSKPSKWNPLCAFGSTDPRSKTRYRREMLLSWLVLAWPEVRWTFLAPPNMQRESNDIMPHPHYFDSVCDQLLRPGDTYQQSTMFDPAGLRNAIRVACGLSEEMTSPLPHWRRDWSAVSIDEEPDYVMLHAYAAYRSGGLCWQVDTLKALKGLFGEGGLLQENGEGKEHRTGLRFPDVSLEDLFMNFPDKDHNTHLSKDEERAKHAPVLQKIANRYLITVGHGRVRGKKRKPPRREDWKNCRRVIYKPTAGLHDLIVRAQLKFGGRYSFENQVERLGRRLSTLSEGLNGEKDVPGKESGHSAPGRLMRIAEDLTVRAELIAKDVVSTEDALHAALLALEAKELLGGATPTMSLQALGLQHRMEVVAECLCLGVQYDFEVENRFREIEREVRIICRWFRGGRERRSAELSAMTTIIGDLARTFRDNSQFDEEIACLNKLRSLKGWSLIQREPYWTPLIPIYFYFAFLLASIRNFVIVLALWAVIFTLIKCCFLQPDPDLGKALGETMGAMFFNYQGESSEGASAFEMVVGGWTLVHLGVFFGHVHSMLMRR